MKKIIKNINFDLIIYTYIITVLTYLFCSNICVLYCRYTVFNMSIGLMGFGFVGLYIYILNKVYRKLKFNIYDLIVILLVLFGIISTIFSIHVKTSLFGFVDRNEGLFQLFTYYIIFLNCRIIQMPKVRSNIIKIIIMFTVIESLYGILQFFNVKKIFNFDIIRYVYYSIGFETCSNFFGTVTLIGLSLSLAIYFFSNNKKSIAISFFTSIITCIGLFCSGTMSVWVGAVVMGLCLIIMLFIVKSNVWKTFCKIFLLFACAAGGYLFFNVYDDGHYARQINQCINDIFDSFKGEAKPIYGSGRIHIWSKTLEIVPDNLLTGVGIDNYYYAFGDKPLIDIKSKKPVDKAHNEYLHKLISEGIFSLITYMFLLGMISFKVLKQLLKDKNKNTPLFCALVLCFIGYCVQAFFNISIISIAPTFYVVMGLMCSLLHVDQEKLQNKDIKSV